MDLNMNANVTSSDRTVLRNLAKRVAEIAVLDEQQEKIELWKNLNSLMPKRPMVLAYPEGGWREVLPESVLQCTDQLLRDWEIMLRKTIFQHEGIYDDQPITDFFNIGWVIETGDFGLSETRSRTSETGSFGWQAPVKSMADVDKLHPRQHRINRDETTRRLNLAREIFGDILKVRVYGPLWWSVGLTDKLIMLRGLEQVMIDMYENPALLHRIMSLLRDDAMATLDLFEKEGVLSLNCGPDDFVGSAGVGATDELPSPGFDGRVRPGDMWVLGESQEFVGVGPDQFDEFALQYQLPILNRFGLVCYGCCEPLDSKFDLITRRIRRLRRVSVSPWCDRRLAAQKLGDRYIYSWKPNPASICGPTVDYDFFEREIRETLQIAKGCCIEMVMKDTHTFNSDPQRVKKWTRIALQLAKNAS
jgi:hypothetical protein